MVIRGGDEERYPGGGCIVTVFFFVFQFRRRFLVVQSGTAWRGKSVLDLVFFFFPPACSLSSRMDGDLAAGFGESEISGRDVRASCLSGGTMEFRGLGWDGGMDGWAAYWRGGLHGVWGFFWCSS